VRISAETTGITADTALRLSTLAGRFFRSEFTDENERGPCVGCANVSGQIAQIVAPSSEPGACRPASPASESRLFVEGPTVALIASIGR
jgi:hypothetical protein